MPLGNLAARIKEATTEIKLPPKEAGEAVETQVQKEIQQVSEKRVKQQINEAIASLSEDERMNFEERAAIMEFDGGLSREEAEKQALEIVLNRRETHGLHE